MPTPADLARVIYRRKEQTRLDEQVELSRNRHFAYEPECAHHCAGCCPALSLGPHLPPEEQHGD